MIRWRKFQVGFGRGRAGFNGMWKQVLVGVANALAAETDLCKATLEANGLYKNGQAVKFTALGTTAANGNNKTLRAYFGGTKIFDSGALVLNNDNWVIEGLIVRTASKVQFAYVWAYTASAVVAAQKTALAIDDTADQVLKVTGQGSVSNDIVNDYLDADVKTV